MKSRGLMQLLVTALALLAWVSICAAQVLGDAASGVPPVGSGVANPLAYGAKCDAVTNDSPAFQAALNSVGVAYNAVFIPASANGCLLNTALTYDAVAKGPLMIFGYGPKSKLLVNNTTGGINITGSCGTNVEKVYLKDFSLNATAGSVSGYGITMNGIALYGIDDIQIEGGTNGFTYGIRFLGTQQGHIHGGISRSGGTGIYLNDCTGGAGAVSSNSNEISGRNFSDTVAGVDFEGGASGNALHGGQITNSTYGVILNQTTGAGGYGPNWIYNIGFENIATRSVNIISGHLSIKSSGIGLTGVHVGAAGVTPGALLLEDSLLNGPIVVDSGALATLTNNVQNDVLTNNGTTIRWNNTVLGQQLLTGVIYSVAGTPLPTCSAAIKGAQATVSDANGPTYGGTYAGSGAVTKIVVCDGTNWKT